MSRVDANADLDWKSVALEAVRRAASVLPEFIVDEVWKFLPQGVDTHDLRAMGPVMRRAHSKGYIEATNRYELSARVTSHGNPRRIWVSRIYPN